MFVVEMYCNEFEKQTMTQIHSNLIRKSLTRDLNFLGYKVHTNIYEVESSGFILSVIILYRIHMLVSVNGKTNPT